MTPSPAKRGRERLTFRRWTVLRGDEFLNEIGNRRDFADAIADHYHQTRPGGGRERTSDENDQSHIPRGREGEG
jgi:hypothetical protein